MILKKASAEIINFTPNAYGAIEKAGRICYKSESSISPNSDYVFVKKVTENHHEAMLEHASATVKFVVDRGVSHELVRHRLASFAQESTRYCNYSKDKFGNQITVIEPCFFWDIPEETRVALREEAMKYACVFRENPKEVRYFCWYQSCLEAEHGYFSMLDAGATPQEARSVLPNSLKTEVIMTANMREWRHFFKLRAAGETGKMHPQMAEVAIPLLRQFRHFWPAIFGDIEPLEEMDPERFENNTNTNDKNEKED